MKSYTDIEQSKKLTEILSLKSADMFYIVGKGEPVFIGNKMVAYGEDDYDCLGGPDVLCWSLAALFSALPKEINIKGQRYAPCLFPVQDKWLLKLWYNSNYTITSPIAIFSDNPVDACVDMILKLNELNLL